MTESDAVEKWCPMIAKRIPRGFFSMAYPIDHNCVAHRCAWWNGTGCAMAIGTTSQISGMAKMQAVIETALAPSIVGIWPAMDGTLTDKP
jgi:hypothetical protein